MVRLYSIHRMWKFGIYITTTESILRYHYKNRKKFAKVRGNQQCYRALSRIDIQKVVKGIQNKMLETID